MSRSKKLGSIYANNRKRRVVSDDEHSEDELIVDSVNHNTLHSTEDMKRNSHHDHAGNGHQKKVDPVERCQAKLRSLRQHLAVLRHEAEEVEKEISRWEWEAAAAAKAAKARAREAERASTRNGHMHGYTMSGTAAQKRRRVLHYLDEVEEDEAALWGPAGTARGGRYMHELNPSAGKSTTTSANKTRVWEHAMDEDDDDHEDDDHHGVVEIDDMDMAMEHDTDEDSGASAWGKLIDKVPSPRQEFEVIIERPPSTLPVHRGIQPKHQAPAIPAVSAPEGPLFFESSEDFTDSDSSPMPTQPPNPPPKQTPNLCFSPLALSAPAPANKDNNQPFSPLSLLPITPMRMATRPRAPSDRSPSSGNDSNGGAESITPPPHLITPKRPPTTAVSSSAPHSAGKTFVPSPGFFGTYEEKRRMAGLEPLPRVEFDEFEGGISRSQEGQANRGQGISQGEFLRVGCDAVPGV